MSHMLIWCLSYWEGTILFSTEGVPFYTFTSNIKGYNFFIYRYEVVYIVLVCISLTANDVEHLSMYLLVICVFGEMSIQILCPIFKWVIIYWAVSCIISVLRKKYFLRHWTYANICFLITKNVARLL